MHQCIQAFPRFATSYIHKSAREAFYLYKMWLVLLIGVAAIRDLYINTTPFPSDE